MKTPVLVLVAMRSAMKAKNTALIIVKEKTAKTAKPTTTETWQETDERLLAS